MSQAIRNNNVLTHMSSVLVPLVAAAVMTLLLFYIMYILVRTEPVDIVDVVAPILPAVVLDERDSVDPKYDSIVRPEPIEEPPEMLDPPQENMVGEGVEIPTLNLPKETFETTLRIGVAQHPVPRAMVQPRYPQKAIRRNLEGWVLLQFDVNKRGEPENIQVVSSQPEGIFDSAAKNAVSRWRYQPLVDDEGQPATFRAMRKRITFKLDK
ncbi:energy transducer TonB [Agaribacterium sp. ZY112]|uniref:energy transducer TonB n=1 Tax=Agaribacterium sp. ZY112 TaxID=3233574 RepID=UPI0035258240